MGAMLALGASTANARMFSENSASITLGSSATSHYSAAALKALDLRWEAIGKAYHLQSGGNATRPDDRAGIHGV
jgi:hypothetical protein